MRNNFLIMGVILLALAGTLYYTTYPPLTTHMNETFIQGNYTIVFVDITEFRGGIASPDSLGFTTYNKDIYIDSTQTKITAVEICWHEKMHNEMTFLELSGEEEHDIINNAPPNYFDETCRFIYFL